jgi:CHAT domain-containing protein
MTASQWLLVLFSLPLASVALAQSDRTQDAGLDSVVTRFEAGDFPDALRIGSRWVVRPMSDETRITLLNYLGATCYQLARYDEAVGHLRRALRELEKSDNSARLQVSLLNDLGESLRAAGRFAAAVDTIGLALRLIRESAPGSEVHAQILNNAAGLHRDQGDFATTESLLREALEIKESQTGLRTESFATAHLNLAELLRFQARYIEARPLYEKALALARSAYPPQHPELVYFLNQFAALLSEQSAYAEAESLRSEALQILATSSSTEQGPVGYPILQAMLWSDRASDELAQGEPAQAVLACLEALRLQREIYGATHVEVGASLARLARAEWESGTVSPSVIQLHASEALRSLESTVTAPQMRAEAHAVRGLAFLALNRRGEAADDFTQAIEIVEQLRGRHGGGDESRARLLVRNFSYYDEAIHLALSDGRWEKATELIERFRARALQERLLLDERRLLADIPETERSQLLRSLRSAEVALVALQDRKLALAFDATLTSEKRSTLLSALERELESAALQFTAAQEELRRHSSAWQALVRSQTKVSLADVQSGLLADERMLVYWVGPAHGWTMSIPAAGDSVQAWRLEVGAHQAIPLGLEAGPLDLHRLARGLGGESAASHAGELFGSMRGVLIDGAEDSTPTNRTGSKDAIERLHALWQLLVPAPLWAQLQAAKEIVILPCGPLYALPFEALVVSTSEASTTRYWLDEGPPLRYADSMATLRQLADSAAQQRRYPPVDVLSVSNPKFIGPFEPLPGTALESQLVRNALGGDRVQSLAEDEASEAAVRRACTGKRYVHLATHGFVEDETSSVLAGLILARGDASVHDDGRLQLYELDDLHLDAQLAVLSACRTAAGKRIDSEGVFALSRGFHVAGALRVVASLWPVNDASTAELIGAFFGNIARSESGPGPIPYALALRNAKRAVRNTTGWDSPYHWAPFLLSGAR